MSHNTNDHAQYLGGLLIFLIAVLFILDPLGRFIMKILGTIWYFFLTILPYLLAAIGILALIIVIMEVADRFKKQKEEFEKKIAELNKENEKLTQLLESSRNETKKTQEKFHELKNYVLNRQKQIVQNTFNQLSTKNTSFSSLITYETEQNNPLLEDENK